MRPSDPKGVLKIGVSQHFVWPGLYKARRQYFEEQLKYYEMNKAMLDAVIRKEVNNAYYQLWYLQDISTLYQRLDTMYSSMYKAADLMVKTGEAAGLDRISAEVKMKELKAQLQQNKKNITLQQQQLSMLLNTDTMYLPLTKPLEKLSYTVSMAEGQHPSLALQQQNINIANANISVQQNTNKP